MGSPTVFTGSRTKFLTSKGALLKDGSIIDNDGVLNFIKNGHAEIDTTGWATYADAAGSAPVDGTGGVANVTWTRSTTTPLAGSGSFVFTKDAANRQGQGVSYAFSIDTAFKARVINIQFDYIVGSGTFVAGSTSADSDLTVWLYDVTNSVLIQPSSYKLLSNSSTIADTFQSTFQTSATGSSYRLIVHCSTTSASAYTVKFDNVVVTPTNYAFGTPVTDWTAYSIGTVGGATTNPTVTWNDTNSSKWRRVGDSMEIYMNVATTSVTNAGSGVYFWPLPSGYTIDTNKTAVYTTAVVRSDRVNAVGNGSLSGNGSTTGWSTALGTGATVFAASLGGSASYLVMEATSNSTMVGSANYSLATTGFFNYTIHAMVPILGWSSSVQMSQDTSTRVIAAFYNISGSPNINGGARFNFDAKGFDTTNSVTTGVGTWQFVAPVEGFYQFEIGIKSNSVAWTAGNNAQASLVTTGGTRAFSYIPIQGTNTNNIMLQGSIVQYMNAGNTAYVTTDASITVTAQTGNGYISIFRLSGPNQIAASEEVSCRYYNISGQSIPNGSPTTITGWTKSYDSHGAFNPTTGIYTVPISGRYRFSGLITYNQATTGINVEYLLYINSVRVGSSYGQAAVSTTISIFGSDCFDLIAGTQVPIQTYQTTGGARTLYSVGSDPSYTHITIERLK